jgi:hypothetical protein
VLFAAVRPNGCYYSLPRPPCRAVIRPLTAHREGDSLIDALGSELPFVLGAAHGRAIRDYG